MDLGLKGFIWTLLQGIFTKYDSMVYDVERMLTLEGLDSELWKGVMEIAKIVFQPFATTIIVICLMLEIAQTTAKVDMLKWEHGIKLGVKMVLSKVAIGIVPSFLLACYIQSVKFIASVPLDVLPGGRLDAGGGIFKIIKEADIEFFDELGAMFGTMGLSIVFSIIIWLCGIIATVIIYGRIFELLIYVAISPIPVAFLPLSGGNENYSRITMNFLKNFIALSLQGVMMYLTLVIYSIICNARIQNIVEKFGEGVGGDHNVLEALTTSVSELAIYSIVLVFALSKCSSWAKSIMDAH